MRPCTAAEEDDESCAELACAREHGFAVRLEERYVIAFGKLAGLWVVDGVCHDAGPAQTASGVLPAPGSGPACASGPRGRPGFLRALSLAVATSPNLLLTRQKLDPDMLAKEGKPRDITVTGGAALGILRTLTASDNGLDALFAWQDAGGWHQLHSYDVSTSIAEHSGGHFTAREFRTWNATVLMALQLANFGPAASVRDAKRAITAGVRAVAQWLGDTPAVARSSYIDPRLIGRYESDGRLASIPVLPAALPAGAAAGAAVAALLSSRS